MSNRSKKKFSWSVFAAVTLGTFAIGVLVLGAWFWYTQMGQDTDPEYNDRVISLWVLLAISLVLIAVGLYLLPKRHARWMSPIQKCVVLALLAHIILVLLARLASVSHELAMDTYPKEPTIQLKSAPEAEIARQIREERDADVPVKDPTLVKTARTELPKPKPPKPVKLKPVVPKAKPQEKIKVQVIKRKPARSTEKPIPPKPVMKVHEPTPAKLKAHKPIKTEAEKKIVVKQPDPKTDRVKPRETKPSTVHSPQPSVKPAELQQQPLSPNITQPKRVTNTTTEANVAPTAKILNQPLDVSVTASKQTGQTTAGGEKKVTVQNAPATTARLGQTGTTGATGKMGNTSATGASGKPTTDTGGSIVVASAVTGGRSSQQTAGTAQSHISVRAAVIGGEVNVAGPSGGAGGTAGGGSNSEGNPEDTPGAGGGGSTASTTHAGKQETATGGAPAIGGAAMAGGPSGRAVLGRSGSILALPEGGNAKAAAGTETVSGGPGVGANASRPAGEPAISGTFGPAAAATGGGGGEGDPGASVGGPGSLAQRQGTGGPGGTPGNAAGTTAGGSAGKAGLGNQGSLLSAAAGGTGTSGAGRGAAPGGPGIGVDATSPAGTPDVSGVPGPIAAIGGGGKEGDPGQAIGGPALYAGPAVVIGGGGGTGRGRGAGTIGSAPFGGLEGAESLAYLPGRSQRGFPPAPVSGVGTHRGVIVSDEPEAGVGEGGEGPFLAHRTGDVRPDIAKKMGGSDETEAAVKDALAFLARCQEKDGHWTRFKGDPDPDGNGTSDRDMGLTGLATLCFLAVDHRPDRDGPYRNTVSKALDYLIANQKDDGDLRGKGHMYSHGMAALAIIEAAVLTGERKYRDAATKAAAFIVKAQNRKTGGWRYKPGESGDTSVLGWQVMALYSVQHIGMEVPDTAFQGATRWLDRVSSNTTHRALAGYTDQIPQPAMSAEAAFSRILMGQQLTEEQIKELTDYLLKFEPGKGRNDLLKRDDFYTWYYTALILMQLQGDAWNTWNAQMKTRLLETQERQGVLKGSWDPNTKHAWLGGRVYSTAMATLTLQVYYRYLPSYTPEQRKNLNR